MTTVNQPDVADFLRGRAARVLAESGVPRAEESVDVRQVALIERADELARTSPPGKAAFESLWTHATAPVPLDPKRDVPSGKPLTDVEAVFEWWSERPADGCGFVTGPQPGRTHSVLAVAVSTWSAWTAWRAENAEVVTRIGDYGHKSEHREARVIGSPVFIKWAKRSAPGVRVLPLDAQATEAMDGVRTVEVVARLGGGQDRGGWVLWHVEGHPRWTRRQLAAGLVVLEPGAVVPAVVMVKPGGWHLASEGGPPDLLPLPDWLAGKFGMRTS